MERALSWLFSCIFFIIFFCILVGYIPWEEGSPSLRVVSILARAIERVYKVATKVFHELLHNFVQCLARRGVLHGVDPLWWRKAIVRIEECRRYGDSEWAFGIVSVPRRKDLPVGYGRRVCPQ